MVRLRRHPRPAHLPRRPHGRDRRRHIQGRVLPRHRRARSRRPTGERRRRAGGPVPPPGLQGALGGELQGGAAVLQVGAGLVPAGEAGGRGQARFAHSICVAGSSQKWFTQLEAVLIDFLPNLLTIVAPLNGNGELIDCCCLICNCCLIVLFFIASEVI